MIISREAGRQVDIQQQIVAELNAAKSLHLAGNIEAAVERYKATLASHPTLLDVLHPLGIAYQQLGRHAEAAEMIGRWLAHVPQDCDALINLGNSLLALRRAREAVEACQTAAAVRPDLPEAHSTLGIAHHQAGNLAQAEESFRKALRLRPDFTECLFNLGNLLADTDRADEAAGIYAEVLRQRPDLPEVHVNLANHLVRKGQVDEAIEHYNEALRLRPGMPEALLNLGNALFERNADMEGAQRCFEAARDQDPSNRRALNNLATVHSEKGDMAAALAHVRHLLDIHHNDALSHATAAGLFMAAGQWEEGWLHFEWRWLRPNLPAPLRDFGKPEWNGEDISGKTILIYHEQGLGDSIQFVRFVADVASRAGKVVLEVPPNIQALYRQSLKNVTLTIFGEPLPPFDVQVPIMSLARILGVRPDKVPAPVPYLFADPARVAAWRDRLPKGGFRIGIVWQGKAGVGVDKGRSYTLDQMAPVARIPGVTLISLQKGYGLDQLEQLPDRMRVETLGPDFDEGPDAFQDTAAVMQHLDLIISSDTSVAHLAGALGCPVWVPLKFAPDWRWLRNREDSPWYPQTMRLFRQTAPRDWAGVFARLAADVAALKDGDRSRLLPPAPPPAVPEAPFPPVPPAPLPPRRPPALLRPAGQSVVITPEISETLTRYGTMRYPSTDPVTGQSMEAYGEFLEAELRASASTLNNGDTVLEVGARFGVNALPLSMNFDLHVFEPDMGLRDLLIWNIENSGAGGLTIHEGDGTGIDALEMPHLHLIKVSADGMTLPVLHGASRSIARCRPCLYLRNDQPAVEPELLALLRSWRYLAWEHPVPLYWEQNFRANAMNLFPNVVVNNLICVPVEREAVLPYFRRRL